MSHDPDDWLTGRHLGADAAEWTCRCGEISKVHRCGDGGDQPWTVNDDGTVSCPCGHVTITHRCVA